MANTFKTGDRVRRIGATEIGTVIPGVLPGMVKVQYEPRPGTLTLGVFEPGAIEHVPIKAPAVKTAEPAK